MADEEHRRFVEAATVDGRGERAHAMLAAWPELAGAGLDCALVLGDVERVGDVVRDEPEVVARRTGARDWPVLLYPCHSAFARDRAADVRQTVRLLLGAGADPNATAPSPDWPGSTWTPLYGAAGRLHDHQLTRMLLAAGADPDDGESLYHATETPDHACLRVLLEAGAAVEGTNALPHMLDREDPEGARLLLEAGADATGLLPFAVSRGRSPEVLRLLAEHGADVHARGDDGRTAYAGALLNGRDDQMAALEELGAVPEAGPAERLAGAFARGDYAAARELLAAGTDERGVAETDERGAPETGERGGAETGEPTIGRRPVRETGEAVIGDVPLDRRIRAAIVGFAVSRGPDGVAALDELGLGLELRGWEDGRPLHATAWRGDPATVDVLLARGAEVDARASTALATPLGWAIHGSLHGPPGDHLAVARRLVAAGARVDHGEAEQGSDALAAYLLGD
ncbi:MAG: hypothetical protein ACRDPC_14585 [Solirubrobacteraceae bacterium]